MRGIGFMAAASLSALAAGCASTGQSDSYAETGDYDAVYQRASYETGITPGADRVYRDAFFKNTRPSPDHAVPAFDLRQLAAYEGIEGARLAHQIYSEAEAEKLDGACERFVKIEQGETLYDVASLCDIPLPMLMDYNPGVRNPRHTANGQVVEVPRIANPERIALSAEYAGGIQLLAANYIVQPGDTLDKIAAMHVLSPAAIANLNPGVDWRVMPVGMQVKLPVPGASAVAPGRPAPLPRPQYQSYVGDGAYGGVSSGSSGYAENAEVSKLMPYRLRPVNAPVGRPEQDGTAILGVSDTIVRPGSTVSVRAEGLPPNAEVVISGGPNRSSLEEIETATTGPDGSLDARVRVKRSADPGGVVFSARVGDETLYSERVGVLKIDGEDADEEAEPRDE